MLMKTVHKVKSYKTGKSETLKKRKRKNEHGNGNLERR